MENQLLSIFVESIMFGFIIMGMLFLSEWFIKLIQDFFVYLLIDVFHIEHTKN